MDWLLKCSIAIWLVAQVILIMPWRNRWLQLLARKFRPILTYFSMDTRWAMYTMYNTEHGWTFQETFFIRLRLSNGKAVRLDEIFEFGQPYKFYLFKEFVAFKAEPLWPHHFNFIEEQCGRMGLPLESIELVWAHKPWPKPNSPSWFGRVDHSAHSAKPFCEEVYRIHQVVKPAVETRAA